MPTPPTGPRDDPVEDGIKFTDTGAVTIGFRLKRERLLFCVRDTGPGIPPEEQERGSAFSFTLPANTLSGGA